ncbi:hypothetical protein [Staphylococcus phage S6]|nr:hypothetical protein [Staphylococcus phage S6]
MAKKHIGTWNGVPVYTDFLPIGTRRAGDKLNGPKFIVAHDTGNPNTTAQNNVDYYRNTYNIDWNYTASAHIFVDDKECIICVPLDEKAWHVMYNTPTDNSWYGIDANDGAIGVEGCYFSNRSRSLKSFDNYCRVLAFLCKEYKINASTNMPGHQDIQADKQDPGNLLAACGMSRSVSNVDKKVLAYMKNGATSTAKTSTATKSTTKTKAPAKPKKTSTETSTTWKRNSAGILWKTEKATFKCGVSVGIITRKNGPWTGWPQGPRMSKGDTIKYDEIQDFNGYIWVSGKFKGQYVYVPVGKSNGNGKRIGPAWGTFS